MSLAPNDISFSGLIDGLYSTPNPPPAEGSWRIAEAYRLEHVEEMIAVHPHASAGTYAAHKWCTPDADYNVRLCWRGGEPPFRIVMTTSPAAAYLGDDGGYAQEFTRTVDPTYATLYRHTLPAKYAQVTLPAADIEESEIYGFEVTVTDQNDEVITFTWSAEADSSRFKWFDSVAGDDGNNGSFAEPFETFGHGYTLTDADTFIYMYKEGTYAVSDGAAGTFAELDADHCRSHIGVGDAVNVVFDLSGAVFGTGGADITVKNATIEGGPAAFSNIRQFNMSEPLSRMHLCGLLWDTRVGSTGGDNPAGLMTYAIDAPTYHQYISMVDCELLNTSTAAMAVLFSVKYWLIENTVANIDHQADGALVVNAKHGLHTGTMRFNNWQGRTDNGILWVSNQNPSECLNVEYIYNRIASTDETDTYITRWNNQALVGSRPAGFYAQRNSIESLSGFPYTMEAYVGGSNVNYGSTLWDTPEATITDTAGGTAMTVTNVKVADIDNIAEADLGVRGWVIASTLVE